jgi:AAA15 family ATPase/GTPase
MILEFGARNFFSFKEGFEVSLRLNSKCPSDVSNGKNFSNVICIKGSNASGKTNVLKSISFIKEFCQNSFAYKPEEKIMVEPHFESKEPSGFYIDFSLDDIEYRYELELTKSIVVSEILYKKEKRTVTAFERTQDELSYTSQDFADLKKIKIRKNASIISTAHQYEIESIDPIYRFFATMYSNVNNFGYRDIANNIDGISKFYYEQPEIFRFVTQIVKSCDLGINKIEIMTRKDEEGQTLYFPIFSHDVDEDTELLTFHYESSGTKALFSILGLYKIALDSGGVLILDEFDINLHPQILPQLVDLFVSEENSKNAQLIFTTHNNDIMDKLGKYRTVLVNKDKNASYVYRLDEVPGEMLRNDRLISPIYKAGKIGGVPRI